MNPNLLTKQQFKEKMGYSESTYHRRMKGFKVPKYREGYLAITANEIYIDMNVYEAYVRDETAKRMHYEKIRV